MVCYAPRVLDNPCIDCAAVPMIVEDVFADEKRVNVGKMPAGDLRSLVRGEKITDNPWISVWRSMAYNAYAGNLKKKRKTSSIAVPRHPRIILI